MLNYRTILALGLFCMSPFIVSMDNGTIKKPAEAAIPQLPHDLWRVILNDALPGHSKWLNLAVRHIGLTVELAHKIIEAYAQKMGTYPSSEKAIKQILQDFKTGYKSFQQDMEDGLRTYAQKYTLLTALDKGDRALFVQQANTLLPNRNPKKYFASHMLPAASLDNDWHNAVLTQTIAPATQAHWYYALLGRLTFNTAEEIQPLVDLLSNFVHELELRSELLKHHLQHAREKELVHDALVNTYTPLGIACAGIAATLVYAGLNQPSLLTERSSFLYSLSIFTAHAYALGRHFYLKKQRPGYHQLSDQTSLLSGVYLVMDILSMGTTLCYQLCNKQHMLNTHVVPTIDSIFSGQLTKKITQHSGVEYLIPEINQSMLAALGIGSTALIAHNIQRTKSKYLLNSEFSNHPTSYRKLKELLDSSIVELRATITLLKIYSDILKSHRTHHSILN